MNPNLKSPLLRLETAIAELAPKCSYNMTNGKIVEWLTPDIPQPSEADIDAKVKEYEAEWTAKEYARKRQAEYPDWGEQLNKIYDDGITKGKSEMGDPVKAKWPKDNSGPVE